jgi:coproporphyrinogen III oxidase
MSDFAAEKARVEAFTRQLQEEICQSLERIDGRGRFREDPWQRAGGGGGRTRVLEEGEVFEKAGVNTSTVFGELEEAFAKRLQGEGRHFWASGISLVLHPRNPFVPTTHANFRFIVQGGRAWIGGGADLTPYYLFEDDARHFHRTWKQVCDRHDPAYYPAFKAHCDRYFFLKHRGETRGVGGIFFEDVKGTLAKELDFLEDAGRSFLPSYLPIVERRKDVAYTQAQRDWQELRRGRYVEFNLLYDRGTVFGLETHGRTESILMSLPPKVAWRYDAQPTPGSPESTLLEALRQTRDWV